MKRKLIALLSLVMAGSLMLSACGADKKDEAKDGENGATAEENLKQNKMKEVIKGEDPSKLPDVAKNRKDTLIVGTTDPAGKFSPIHSSDKYENWVCGLIFNGMVGNDEKGDPTPDLVESVKDEDVISNDGKTYTFKLKKGIKFSNGEELTAKDVEFTYTALCDPKYDGSRMDAVQELVGFEEYKKGDAKKVEGIKVIDDHTISFTLKNRKASAMLSDFGYGIMPKSVYNFEKGDIQKVKDKFLQPVGSGPYKFVEFKQGESVSFERNENYFKGCPKIPKIIMKVTNANTSIQELQSGNVDIDVIPTREKNIEMLKSAGFLDLNLFPENGYGYIGLNVKDKRFQDKKVRQALTYALDRKGFLENYYGKYAILGNTHCSPVSWAYPKEEDLNPYEFNPEKAKELLDEAGWKMNESTGVREKDGQQLKFSWYTYTGSKYVDSLIPIVKEGWKNVGVIVEPELMEFSTLTQKINDTREFDMFNMSWGMSIDPDPSGIFSKAQDCPGGYNSVGWSTEKSEELMEKGLRAETREERIDIYNEWFKHVNDELPYIFLGSMKELRVSSCRVKNFDVSTYMEWYSNIEKVELEQ